MPRWLMLLLLLSIHVVHKSSARRCYTCGHGAKEHFKNTQHAQDVTKSPSHSGESSAGVSDKSSTDDNFNTTVTGISTRDIHHNEDQIYYVSSSSNSNSNSDDDDDDDVPIFPCEHFDTKNTSAFIVECPSDFMGCITQIDGHKVTRGCEKLAIDDCQAANGITYCYCSSDLCNGLTSGNHSAEVSTQSSEESISSEENSENEVMCKTSGANTQPPNEYVRQVVYYEQSGSGVRKIYPGYNAIRIIVSSLSLAFII